ncbi:cold-shock protein [Stutzerimonas stutzeri]|uniref:cold-shock protein n=1 Tax=Stutzerimonas stutzeri TaxID=316 RepID=UPI003C6FBC2D
MELRGQLKSWNDQRGSGFIRPEQGGDEIFAHISNCSVAGRVRCSLSRHCATRPASCRSS